MRAHVIRFMEVIVERGNNRKIFQSYALVSQHDESWNYR